ncbi:MAG TPA: WG repeat-containing protein [Leptospiraceae bacterium]|nr:WG repeat-containing protein [Leptospiraceae bacterium]HNN59043.1 WG repeat-containing protein [Leptospiraceae bacterium]
MDAYQVKGTNWWGAIDAEGRLLWKREDIHWLGAFVEGYAICVNREFRTGLITATGEVVIEPKYSLLRDYACGLVAYRETEKGKFGYLDNTGKVVIPPKYLSANPFSVEGLAIVQKGKQVRVCIDRNGTELWEIEAEACASFSEGLAPYLVKKGGWGYVDISGQSVITPAFRLAGPFSEGLAGVGSGRGKYTFINKHGERLPEALGLVSGWDFSEGLASVETKSSQGLVGFIDRAGNVEIPPQFVNAGSFKGGLAPVKLPVALGESREWAGFIDRSGRLVFGHDHNLAFTEEFVGHLARVRTVDGRSGYLNRSGRLIWIMEDS